MKHAKLSPSSSARWLACPGSVEANANKPHSDNKYSLEGTSAHTLLEVCMRTGCPPEDFYGKVLKKGHHEVDQGMVDGVGYALDWVAGYLANNPKATLHIEERVDYDEAIGLEKGGELGFGFPDIQLDNYPIELVTLDYKHGVGISVEVDGNTQLRLYAAGKREERGRYRKYRSVVVQPRLRGRKPIQEATYTDPALAKWLTGTVIPIVPIALAGGAPRTAGKHCRYCHADGNCVGQYDLVMAAAKKDFT